MVTSSSDRFNSWIFESFRITPEGLALYRIFVSLMILFFLMPPSTFYSYLGALPDDFYHPPPGPMMLFSSFPPAEILWILHLLLTVSLIAMLLGFYTRWSSLLTGILMLVLKGFIFSIGKINHDLLISMVPIIFSFSHWGKAYSLDAYMTGSNGGGETADRAAGYGWPLTLLALYIGFMFFTAGFPKILGGWLEFSSQATRGHFLNQYFTKERTDLLAEMALGLDNVLFWEFLDFATILFEVSFLAAIFHPVSTRIFICIAVIFHFSTMMIMNIAFLFNFIAYAAFLNWNWIDLKIRAVATQLSSLQTVTVTGNTRGQTGYAVQTETRKGLTSTHPVPESDSESAAQSSILPGWLWSVGLITLFTLIRVVSNEYDLTGESDLILYEVLLLTVAFMIGVYGLCTRIWIPEKTGSA